MLTKSMRPARKYVSEEFTISNWSDVEYYLLELNSRKLITIHDFRKWLLDKSELEAILEEDFAWRYIRMTIDTTDEEKKQQYTFFIDEIQPKLATYSDLLNRKMMHSDFTKQLTTESYQIYFRTIGTTIDIFRKENISIQSEILKLNQSYSQITGKQTINYKDEIITMQQASVYLQHKDAQIRSMIFESMWKRRSDDIKKLDDLFSQLIQLRHQIALNAGFENYRDYKFQEMGRFDYSKEDCFQFHQAIKDEIVPLVREIQKRKAKELGKKRLKPWDLEVDSTGKDPLKPFSNGSELLHKTIQVFNSIDPFFGNCLSTMNELKHLDLESKLGKAPGGYNYPLYEIGIPFIFMNAAGTHRDMVTMIHEGGHAIHSFLSKDLELTGFKNLPSEVAELASMAMELISMNHWNVFYPDKEDLIRAKKEQLETILKILPWIALIDEFQHWLYENPKHSISQRQSKWTELQNGYSTGLIDWVDFEEAQAYAWQRQLHLFEVPFYYIEYGMAQLGALAIWRNSQNDFQTAIASYKEALKLGYTCSIPKIYEAANIKFDFSQPYVRELAQFIKKYLSQSLS